MIQVPGAEGDQTVGANPVGWYGPAGLSGVSLVALGILLWMLSQGSFERRQTDIRQDAEYTASSTGLHLEGNSKYLLLLASFCAAHALALAWGMVSLRRGLAERRRDEDEREFLARVLKLASHSVPESPLTRELAAEIQQFTGCEAVGIRFLHEDGNIPYKGHVGFPEAFYKIESPLSVKSDQCMCINVICGDVDPSLPFVTKGGSFYMNGTTRFLATLSEEDKGKMRNACNAQGYESVALVPIRFESRILGLIHLADKRDDMIPLATVEVVERVAMQLGDSLKRSLAEEELLRHEHFLQRAQEIGTIGTWELDIKKNVLHWTDENYRIFGIPAGTELTYETFLDCVHPDDREYVELQWKAACKKEPYDIEHRLLVDGDVKWVREKAELDFDETGECIRGTGLTQDITERKQAEEKIAASLKEKEVLLREIHHRVKNNLQVIVSLLRMHARRINDTRLARVFDECRDRVNAMSLVHEVLYQSEDLSRIDFEGYLTKLCRNLSQAHGASGRGIEVTVERCNVTLDMDQGIAVGTVISELIGNAFKHAFPLGKGGKVSVSLSGLEGEDVELIVQDDGKGLPPEIDILASPSLGLRLTVAAVTRELGGSIEVAREAGTRFKIRFKCKGA